MSNLLSIEQAFLNLPQVKQAINLTEIKRAKANVNNAQKRKFDHTLKMAKLVSQANAWFESEEGKSLFAEEGIQWNKEDFGMKVFGWQKSYFYKVVKVGNLDDRIIEAFNQLCEQQGNDANRSLAELLKFSREVDLESLGEDATAEEIAEAIEAAAEERESESEERAQTICTLSFKNLPNGKNLSLRIDDEGRLITHNSADDIQYVLSVIQSRL